MTTGWVTNLPRLLFFGKVSIISFKLEVQP